MAFHLGWRGEGITKLGFNQLQDLAFKHGVIRRREIAWLFGGDFSELDDRIDHRLEAGMAMHHSAEHDFFGQFFGFRFNHQHGIGGARDDEVEHRVGHFSKCWVEAELAVDVANACCTNRTHERNTRKRQGRRSGNHRHNIGIVFKVMSQNGNNDLRLVAVAFDKQRTDRTVDQAGNQCFLFRWATFALEIATGNAASGKRLFLIIDGEREEVDARLGIFSGDDGGEHGGFAIGGENGSVRLTRNASGLQGQLAASPGEFYFLNIEHVCLVTSQKSLLGDHEQDDERLARQMKSSIWQSCHDPRKEAGFKMRDASPLITVGGWPATSPATP